MHRYQGLLLSSHLYSQRVSDLIIFPTTRFERLDPDILERAATLYQFGIAEDPQTLAAVFDLRAEIWRREFPYLLGSEQGRHPASDQFDASSHILFASSESGEVVGSCRACPQVDDEWELSASLPESLRLEYDPERCLQLDRVYVRHDCRNVSLHELMFLALSEHVLQHTFSTSYFAICKAELVRLYARLGIRLVSTDGFLLRGRAAHRYFLVEGDIEQCSTKIRSRYLRRGSLMS